MIASLQIQSTVGFAAPSRDHWARNWKVVLLITMHSITTVLFNIFLLGTLFARLSSAKNRAITVKVSSCAVIRPVTSFGAKRDLSDTLFPNNAATIPVLEFRVGEFRRHQLLNLNVSVYFFTHLKGKLFHREKLNIFPDKGVFLAVPTEIKHVLDSSSPFAQFLMLSAATTNSVFCKTCGESFETLDQLKLHVNFVHAADVHGPESPDQQIPITMEQIAIGLQRVTNMYFEIIVLIEGTEPITGSPIQIRHSFNIEDIKIGMVFEKCAEFSPGKVLVNFANFDKIQNPSYS